MSFLYSLSDYKIRSLSNVEREQMMVQPVLQAFKTLGMPRFIKQGQCLGKIFCVKNEKKRHFSSLFAGKFVLLHSHSLSTLERERISKHYFLFSSEFMMVLLALCVCMADI